MVGLGRFAKREHRETDALAPLDPSTFGIVRFASSLNPPSSRLSPQEISFT